MLPTSPTMLQAMSSKGLAGFGPVQLSIKSDYIILITNEIDINDGRFPEIRVPRKASGIFYSELS
jgi:hypothetical protein